MLAQILGVTASDSQPGEAPKSKGVQLGECTQSPHPTLQGRACVRLSGDNDDGKPQWLPCLRNVVCRPGDRVLVCAPENHAEPVVIGVLDGFRRRSAPPEVERGRIELAADEHLTVSDDGGRELVKLRRGQDGLEVQLSCPDFALRVPGKLTLSARELQLEAEEGQARVSASEDVVIQGELVRLN